MDWLIDFHPKFKVEVLELPRPVRIELVASLAPLRRLGPALGRPEVDTLNDSRYANMKELASEPMEGSGGLLSRSIRDAMQSCS